MNRKSIWIGVGLLAMLTLASAVAFADFGSGGRAQDIDINRDKPPRECICTANYEPVVCRAADGSHHTFSNLCVAGCNGFTAASCTAVDDPISE
jgi:hypothetical protein